MKGSNALVLASIIHTCTLAFDIAAEGFFDPDDGEAWELNYGYYPYRSYQTTDLISPQFRNMVDAPECHDDRYVFFTPRGFSISAPGPMIVDSHGELIWAQSTEGQAYDLKVQEYKGEQYLTYWQGDDKVRGHGAGDFYMLNSGYQEVHKISAVNGLAADLHELVITPQGTALLTVYEVYPHDLSQLRNFEEWEEDPHYIWDSLFQEIDIETNELLFQWRASDHYSVDETFKAIGGAGTRNEPFDWYHINSVQKDEFDNYLVSARYTHTVTYINGTSGDIIWILGGKRNMFKDLDNGFATNFAWQHDARFHSKTEFPELFSEDIALHGSSKEIDGVTKQLVTLFDNSAEDVEHTLDSSRGLLLEVTYPSAHLPSIQHDLTKRDDVQTQDDRYLAKVIQSYDHPQGPLSTSQGSVQVIPSEDDKKDSKVFVGYGYNALFSEYSADGTLLCDNHFATNYSWGTGDVQSYRSFKFPWIGRPVDPPTAVLSTDGQIYISWNGATEVGGYVLQHTRKFPASEKAWKNVLHIDKSGFETVIDIEDAELLRYIRIKAVDKKGVMLGVSREIDMGWSAVLTSSVPRLNVVDIAPIKLFMLICINVAIVFVMYELCRRLYTWRQTLKWRHRRGIRLLSDA
ncbi:hypothetical protein E4T52_12306 [Aureobasidium sp. EXF-3400]|nr:hypothetical protein E4T51_11305 [Aureobasidium sp. EXF-12344]KAI4772719.1 hypothetical protein E4T52_12306 [Aureobasidium sp. EXF-3400]